MKIKKYIFIFSVLLGFYSPCLSQERIVVGQESSFTFIETYDYPYHSTTKLDLKYQFYFNKKNAGIIRQGISTALKWCDLNFQHQKEFTKEICRFRGVESRTYDFIKTLLNNNIDNENGANIHYDMASNEFKLLFIGNSDGSSDIQIEVKQTFDFTKMLSLESKQMIEKFKNMLDGESINSDIDDIFKNE